MLPEHLRKKDDKCKFVQNIKQNYEYNDLILV